ncbi:hypothetical protein BV25DRAFT_1044116 [Artomyces pyxidatus]|uniref:Uncharacterized protein n=1 Tax=Artomyces pyxidatus TaxID=48021 RepID=A0ACB8SUS9_9AGAM|nr:hypothetical protein BV25DRAFT_1044116 [Artomyces pyxidatus]
MIWMESRLSRTHSSTAMSESASIALYYPWTPPITKSTSLLRTWLAYPWTLLLMNVKTRRKSRTIAQSPEIAIPLVRVVIPLGHTHRCLSLLEDLVLPSLISFRPYLPYLPLYSFPTLESCVMRGPRGDPAFGPRVYGFSIIESLVSQYRSLLLIYSGTLLSRIFAHPWPILCFLFCVPEISHLFLVFSHLPPPHNVTLWIKQLRVSQSFDIRLSTFFCLHVSSCKVAFRSPERVVSNFYVRFLTCSWPRSLYFASYAVLSFIIPWQEA